MKLSRFLLSFIATISVVAWMSALAGVQIPSKQAGRTAAVLIYGDATSEQQMQFLRTTLVQVYGLGPDDVMVLDDSVATAEGIWSNVFDFIESKRDEFGQVMFYVSLPTHQDREGSTYFVPVDGTLEERWTLLPFEELTKNLSRLSASNMLFIFPQCGSRPTRAIHGPEERLHEALLTLTYGSVASANALSFCDSANFRQSFDADGIRPTQEVLRTFAELLNNELQERGLHGSTDYFDIEELIGALDLRIAESDVSIRTRLRFLPEYQSLHYVFIPQPSELAGYQASYAEAQSLGLAQEILYRITSVATRISGDFSSGVIDMLRDIARYENAGLSASALIPEKELLPLRAFALEQLARIEEPAALESLFEAAEDTDVDPSIRSQAISSIQTVTPLGEVHRARIAALMSDADESVSITAIRAIGRLRDKSAAASLAQIVETSSSDRVRISAVQALALAGDKDAQAYLAELLESVTEPLMRSTVITSIGALGESLAISQKLLELLEEESDTQVLAAVITALPEVSTEESDSRVVRRIERMARHSDTSIQISTMYALAKFKTDRSADALRSALRNRRTRDSVRVAAAESLGELLRDTGDHVPELEEAADAESVDLRRTAVEALGTIGSPRSVAVLEAKLRDRDASVSAAASRALKNLNPLGDEQILSSLASPEERVRYEAVLRLSSAEESPEQVRGLILGIGDTSVRVREQAADALTVSNSPSAEVELKNALGSPFVLVRAEAVSVLGQRGTGSSLEILLDHTDSSPVVSANLLSALSNYRDNRAIEQIVVAATGDAPLEVRLAGINSLAAYRDDPEVRHYLQAIAKEDYSPVAQKAAAQALISSPRENIKRR